MSTKTNAFHQFAAIAIGELFDKGYLLNPLDWDVKAQKYNPAYTWYRSKPNGGGRFDYLFCKKQQDRCV